MRFLNKRIETRNHIEQVTPGAVYVNSRDQGSAVVEVVVLTLPLVVPFAL